MPESGCNGRGDARRVEAGRTTTNRHHPVFEADGRGPSLFMTPLNILKLDWTPCPPPHRQELRASLCLASGVSLRRHRTLGEHAHLEQ